jgi:hypothetical protein
MKLPELEEPQWIQDSYDLYGWAASLSYANTTNFKDHFEMYNNMVAWIKANVVNYHNNALWTKIGDCVYIKLRKEKDAMLFILRFGTQ